MKNPLRTRPWLALVVLAALPLVASAIFIVVAQRHAPKSVELPRPAAKP